MAKTKPMHFKKVIPSEFKHELIWSENGSQFYAEIAIEKDGSFEFLRLEMDDVEIPPDKKIIAKLAADAADKIEDIVSQHESGLSSLTPKSIRYELYEC